MFLLTAFAFSLQILGGFGVVKNKIGYSSSFEGGGGGVVDSGVVAVGSSESF